MAFINTALLHVMTAVSGLRARLSDERGQDLTEYALLTGGIAIALVATVGFFSGAFITWFTAVTAWVNSLAPIV